MPSKKIRKEIKKFGRKLELDDFNNIVEIQHMDGTYCEMHNAFYKEFSKNWFCVYTEHNGQYVNNRLDMKYIKIKSESFV